MRENKIYVWVGEVKSTDFWEVINELFEGEWDEDGDRSLSAFEEAFGLDYFDSDFLGVNLLSNPTNSIDNVFEGFPYANELIQSLKSQNIFHFDREYNVSVTWLHDERINIKRREATIGDNYFNFLTVIELDE